MSGEDVGHHQNYFDELERLKEKFSEAVFEKFADHLITELWPEGAPEGVPMELNTERSTADYTSITQKIRCTNLGPPIEVLTKVSTTDGTVTRSSMQMGKGGFGKLEIFSTELDTDIVDVLRTLAAAIEEAAEFIEEVRGSSSSSTPSSPSSSPEENL